MSLATPPDHASEACATPESAKRQQIIDGARRCFLAFGFEAASMGEIAREAKVSKGTLYVYFDSKEALFSALVEQTKRAAAERLTELDHDDVDVGETLTRLATGLIEKLSTPEHIAMVRMVIGAAEKFPDIARSYYDAAPGYGAARLTRYLREQERRGILDMDDAEIAAWHFLGMCNQPTLIGGLFAASSPPDAARIRRLAEIAVSTFLAAYRAKW